MTQRRTSKETFCPFTGESMENAYGSEIALVLHCHLRGYDRQGEGLHPDLEYYDKYGAPPRKVDSWEEGYHVIERRLADHYKAVMAMQKEGSPFRFPLVAGMGGGVHLYKSLHDDEKEPWNWTGWIPLQRRWLSEGTFFSNRHFLGLRGNEIQNNLWDYDPHEEAEGADPDEMVYSQVEPNDRYRGGYWYYCQPFGRYLHIISLKSHEKDPKTNTCLRYNYIVHPLAYRAAIDTLPDNSVDAMQWCIINIPDERHFGEGKPWGEKCHGLEIFNDFTYYYSYQRIEEDGPNNSELGYDPENAIDGDHNYYYWFDTYPMEFAVFLLDSALARGVYLHTMCANDAFYEKTELCKEGPDEILVDPKANLFKHNMKNKNKSKDQRLGVTKAAHAAQPIPTNEEAALAKALKKIDFLVDRPYGRNTSFGFVTLIDVEETIKKAVFTEKNGIPNMGLNVGEKMAMEYLNEGFYYATTGLHKLFQCDFGTSKVPYKIAKQSDPEKLCYNLTGDMSLIFTFLRCTERNADLIWRYTIMCETEDGDKLESSHGYFKLDKEQKIKLDLSKSYDLSSVKWLYFTAISPNNPQRRAWFHAIKGPAFGEPQYKANIQELSHKVVLTTRTGDVVTATRNIDPTPINLHTEESKYRQLDFALGTGFNNKDIYVYFMQACPLQQDFSEPVSDKIKESSDSIPPRILQSVHGYFQCRDDHPTRLNLNASWDKNTVKDNVVYFYRIDADTGAPFALGLNECKPELFIKQRLVIDSTDNEPKPNNEKSPGSESNVPSEIGPSVTTGISSSDVKNVLEYALEKFPEIAEKVSDLDIPAGFLNSISNRLRHNRVQETPASQNETTGRTKPHCSICKQPMKGHKNVANCPKNQKRL